MTSPKTVLIGLGGGLASAVLFYSAARGGLLLKLVLFVLTPLPAMIAGLGWGPTAAAAGAIAGAAVMAVAASPAFGLGYFVALGLPAIVIAWLADLGRARADGTGVDWLPAGALLGALTLYGGFVPLVIAALIGGNFEGLRPAILPFVRDLMGRVQQQVGGPAPTDAGIEAWTGLMIEALPPTIAAYWVLLFALNLYLSSRVTRASGHLVRPWPDLHRLSFPRWVPVAFALAIAATYFGGSARLIGSAFSGALLIGYMLSGLSVLHCISKGRVPWLLWLVYAGLVNPAGPYVMIMVALIGLAEPLLGLRDRLSKSPPPPAAPII
jgi:hypothetical protein